MPNHKPQPFDTAWRELFRRHRWRDPIFVLGVIVIAFAYGVLIWAG